MTVHRISGPAWIVQPGAPDQGLPGGGEAPDQGLPVFPSHPIVLPPDVEEPGEIPSHPIVLPPEDVDPGWGVEEGGAPDQGLPGGGEGPDNTLPGNPYPDQGLPGTPGAPDQGLPGAPAVPDHPIWIEPFPDNGLPAGAEKAGDLSFYQRKTLGINWDASLLKPAAVVGIYVVEGGSAKLVRTVANNGSSSVTFPSDFKGTRTFRVSSGSAYCEGTAEIK